MLFRFAESGGATPSPRRVGEERIMGILRPLRNSKIDMETYAKVRNLRLTASADEAEFPHLWEHWRTANERFNLDDELILSDCVPIVDLFINRGRGAPQKLSLVNCTLLHAALAGNPKRAQPTHIWTDTVLLFTDLSSSTYLLLKGVSSGAEMLIDQIRSALLGLKLSLRTLDGP